MSARPTLLIVDDESPNLEIMVESLSRSGSDYRVYQANGGALALQIARKRLPDLIITDWDMPGMSGLELIRALKADPATAEIPVIMCSGVMTSAENLRLALDTGAVDYVRKPLDPIELQARVHSMLELARSHREVRRLSAQKDEIFATLSQSLLESVGNLYSMLELLREIWSVERMQAMKLLDLASGRSRAALDLLRNLLIWSRCYFEKLDYRPEAVPLMPLVKSLLGELAAQALEAEVFLGTDLSPELRVMADPQLLQLILRQLILNALQASPAGSRVTVEAAPYEGDAIRIRVRDFGPGIPPAIAGGEAAAKGIGLRLVRELLHRHGSSLVYESPAGRGTLAGFVLPAAGERGGS